MLPPAPWAAPPCAHAHGHPLSADQKGGGALGCFGWKFSKKRRRPRQLECVKRYAFCTRKASVSSVGNSRTRRAVHTLVVWTGELSMRGKGMNSAPAFAAFEELKERYSPCRVRQKTVVTKHCRHEKQTSFDRAHALKFAAFRGAGRHEMVAFLRPRNASFAAFSCSKPALDFGAVLMHSPESDSGKLPR